MEMWNTKWTKIRCLKYWKTASFGLKYYEKKSWYFLLTNGMLPTTSTKPSRPSFAYSLQVV